MRVVSRSCLPAIRLLLIPVQQAVIDRVHHAACGVGNRLHVLLRCDVSSAVAKVVWMSFTELHGFCVLRIKTKGHREETTVVGSLPSVTAGEWLAAN
jgi:hypothetical protein